MTKSKFLISSFILSLFLFVSVNGQLPTAWRGGTGGNYPGQGHLKTWPANGPQVLWSYGELGQGHSSPVVSGNFLYTSGMTDTKGYLFKFTLDGKLVYSAEYGPEYTQSFFGTRGSPVIAGDLVYLVSGYGIVYCLNEKDGSKKWTVDMVNQYGGDTITWGYNETPVIDGDRIFLTPGGTTACMIALNRFTGSLLWKTPGSGELSAYCTPLLFNHKGRKLLATHTASHLICVDAETGKFLWKYPQPNQWSVHANTPLYNDGGLFFFSGYGQGSGKLQLNDDGTKASLAWENKSMDSRMGGVVFVNGYLYGSGDFKKEWKCIDWNTGENTWTSSDIAKGVVIYSDGMLYLYSDKGELAMAKADPLQFKVASQTKVTLGSEQHWAHPVIHNGVLYLRHGKALIAYKIK